MDYETACELANKYPSLGLKTDVLMTMNKEEAERQIQSYLFWSAAVNISCGNI